MNSNCRDPLGDPQTVPPVTRCEGCEGELYRGELRYLWEGRALCLECFQAVIHRLLKDSPLLLAQDLGVETQLCTGPTWEEADR